eukprot:472970_1
MLHQLITIVILLSLMVAPNLAATCINHLYTGGSPDCTAILSGSGATEATDAPCCNPASTFSPCERCFTPAPTTPSPTTPSPTTPASTSISVTPEPTTTGSVITTADDGDDDSYSESSDSYSDSSSSSSDSMYNVAAHVVANVRDDLLGNEATIEDETHYTMSISLSDFTLMNIWGLFGVLMIANMLWMFRMLRNRNQTQKVDLQLEQDEDGGSKLEFDV